MSRIGISTAAFCLWDITPQGKLDACEQLGFNTIEVALSTHTMLKNYIKYDHVLDKLVGFKNMTIHAPWRGFKYGKNLKTNSTLDYLRSLHHRLNVEAFVFHCDSVQDYGVLEDSGLPVYLENSEREGSWEGFCQAVKDYPFECVLNINRATRNDDYLDVMLDEFKSRINRVYISGYDDVNGRMPLLNTGQQELLDKVRGLSVPFVMEGLFAPGDYVSILREKELISQKIAVDHFQEV